MSGRFYTPNCDQVNRGELELGFCGVFMNKFVERILHIVKLIPVQGFTSVNALMGITSAYSTLVLISIHYCLPVNIKGLLIKLLKTVR
jgi:hypothetical protein